MKQIIFPSLTLSDWKETRDTLHKYCRLVGAIRESLSKPLPHELHTNLLVCRKGFTTSHIAKNDFSPEQTFEVIIDLSQKKLRIESNYREPLYVALTGQSLNALCDETCSLLIDIGVKPPLERPSFLDGARGRFDAEPVKAYWKTVISTNKILSKIKVDLGKKTSPVQLHVDDLTLSMTWFYQDVFTDSSLEQVDIGFSTGDVEFTEAYFFITSFPDSQSLKKIFREKKNYLFTKDNSEMILPYSEVAGHNKAEELLLDFFKSIKKL